MVEMTRVVEVIKVVYRYEENLGVKGPKSNNSKSKAV